jgi:predicted RNA-binding Zn-ribbon protein involved in translation (DUF1610 family)
LAVVVVALMALGEDSGEKSGSSSHASSETHKGESRRDGSSGDGDRDIFEGDTESGRRAPVRGSRLLCPNCGLQLPVALGQPGYPCPRCGAPTVYR